MLLDGYNWHHILKTLSPNEGCYMCLIQKIKQKYVDCNAIIKDGTFRSEERRVGKECM